MAKFGSYFGLCPLIDHRSLLGISEDSEIGNVIVTLGKNIAMKYRLLDQNQIISWTTKEKFTSPVIFDAKSHKYVAVFNHLFIRSWESDNSNLDKVKKFKFKSNVDSIIAINDVSLVIFETGHIVTLEYALTNHKNLVPEQILDKSTEYIMDTTYCHLRADTYMGLLVGNLNSNKVSHLLWANFDSVGNRSEYTRLPIRRNSCELVGYCFHLLEQQVQFLTLWSDGKLYVKSIEDNSENLGEMFCVIESVSCKDPVSIVSLDKDYLAIYGGNSNQEGALLIIYNNQFKVTQCMQPFKLQTIGGKLYKIQEKLLLPVGQNLAVIPYHLEKEQLSALVGSHSTSLNDGKDILVIDQFEELNWASSVIVKKQKSKSLSIIKDYLEQGCPESTIFEEILPACIESTNIKDLKLLLREFIDIPENCHAKVLLYVLELPEETFRKSKEVSDESYPNDLQPLERYELLKLILEKPLQEINNNTVFWRLELDVFLKLLKFILYLLKDDNNVTDLSFCIKLVKWVNLIFCANYQLLFSSNDQRIVEILSAFNELIDLENSFSNSEFLVLIEEVIKGKRIRKIRERGYTIEKIVI